MPQLTLRLGRVFREQVKTLRERDAALCSLVVRAASSLPSNAESPLDTIALMPPDGREYFTRRVPNKNVWIWYRVVGLEVVVNRVSETPPVPTYSDDDG